MIKGARAAEGERHEVRLPREPRLRIDEVDKAIIEHLQEDGRRPYDEIGRGVGLSAAEVEKRVAALVDQEIIQIVAVTDPLQLGFARQAMIGITVDGPQKPVAERLAAIPGVVYVVITAGGFDILVEVVGESDAHLLELVTSGIRPIPGVTAVHTFLYLELEKQTYTWGTR